MKFTHIFGKFTHTFSKTIEIYTLLHLIFNKKRTKITRSSWLNCALGDDEAVYWVSKGHYEAVAVDDTGSVEGTYAFIY